MANCRSPFHWPEGYADAGSDTGRDLCRSGSRGRELERLHLPLLTFSIASKRNSLMSMQFSARAAIQHSLWPRRLTLAAHMPGGGIFATPALADSLLDPLSPKQPHFPPKVKSVIWLHMDGAPSTLDLYDYKPDLIKLAGQETPPSFLQGIKTSTQGGVGKLFVSNRTGSSMERAAHGSPTCCRTLRSMPISSPSSSPARRSAPPMIFRFSS